MPVNTKHPQYDIEREKLTTDAYNADVKKYIPKISGMNSNEFKKYVERATYYNVVKRTLSALLGAVLRKPVESNVDLDELYIDGNQSFKQFVGDVICNVMLGGRSGILVDYNDKRDVPSIVTYKNSEIINWRYDDDDLTMVIIEESGFIEDPKDPYKLVPVMNIREMVMVEGVYTVNLYQQEKNKKPSLVETFEPTFRGNTLPFIPFTFVSVEGECGTPADPILYNLAQINVAHYKQDADYAHVLHFTALPQPYLSGDLAEDPSIDTIESEFVNHQDAISHKKVDGMPIGSFDVWHLEQGSTVGYMEVSGQSIAAIEGSLKHKEEQMATLGARMLSEKAGVESVEALRMRQGSESATLIELVDALESALHDVVKWYQEWNGVETDVEITMNRDFTPEKLSPQEIKSLMDAVVSGTLSREQFLENLYKGEIISDLEAEKDRFTTDK